MQQNNYFKKPITKVVYKYRGRLFNFKVNSNGMLELILYKGSKKEPIILVLTSFKKDLNANVLHMIQKQSVKRFLIRFSVVCKEWNGKYFTNCVLERIEEWKPMAQKTILEEELPEYNPNQISLWGENNEF
jgi:hypothetical protein